MGTLTMTKPLEKMIRQAKNVQRITRIDDTHTISIQKQIHSAVKYGEEKSKTNTYKCRKIILEKDCKYFILMSRQGRIEFVKSHEHSKKSVDLMDMGECPRSFNGGYSTLDGQVYLRCDEVLHTVFKGGISTLRLLFEVEVNCVIYLIDGKPIENDEFLYNNKFYPEYELVRHATEYEYDVVEKYSPELHCKALLNHYLSDTYIKSIPEDEQFLALSIGQLFSLPHKMDSEGFIPSIKFKLRDFPETGCNQYPFKYNFIPYENSYGILCDFLSRLRNNIELSDSYHKKNQNTSKSNKSTVTTSDRISSEDVIDSWESLDKPDINLFEDIMKQEMDNKLASSDPGKVQWSDFSVSSEDEEQIKELQDKLGLSSTNEKKTKRGKKIRKINLSEIKFTEDELRSKLSVQEEVETVRSRVSTYENKIKKKQQKKINPVSSKSRPQTFFLDKMDSLDTVSQEPSSESHGSSMSSRKTAKKKITLSFPEDDKSPPGLRLKKQHNESQLSTSKDLNETSKKLNSPPDTSKEKKKVVLIFT